MRVTLVFDGPNPVPEIVTSGLEILCTTVGVRMDAYERFVGGAYFTDFSSVAVRWASSTDTSMPTFCVLAPGATVHLMEVVETHIGL
jgi:hypothetical protein